MLRALEARLESDDGDWLEAWHKLARHGGEPPVMASAHGRTLERFNGFFTRLYLMAADTIEQAGSPRLRVSPEASEE